MEGAFLCYLKHTGHFARQRDNNTLDAALAWLARIVELS